MKCNVLITVCVEIMTDIMTHTYKSSSTSCEQDYIKFGEIKSLYLIYS